MGKAVVNTTLFFKKGGRQDWPVGCSLLVSVLRGKNQMQKTTYCMIPYMRCTELAHLGKGIGCERHLRDFGAGV